MKIKSDEGKTKNIGKEIREFFSTPLRAQFMLNLKFEINP